MLRLRVPRCSWSHPFTPVTDGQGHNISVPWGQNHSVLTKPGATPSDAL
jgi:hypothetical protein